MDTMGVKSQRVVDFPAPASAPPIQRWLVGADGPIGPVLVVVDLRQRAQADVAVGHQPLVIDLDQEP